MGHGGGPDAAAAAAEAPPARASHIEVCVRLRPLTVADESSSGFFRSGAAGGRPAAAAAAAPVSGLPTPQHGRQGKASSCHVGQRLLQKLAQPPAHHPSPQGLMHKTHNTGLSNSHQRSHAPLSSRATGAAGPGRGGGGGGGDSDPPMYAWDIVSEDTIAQSPRTDLVQGRTHAYTLDRVYGPATSNRGLYEASVRPLIHAAMDGYHAAVLAYGQTSTGKTYTMSGTASSPGVIPLCVHECFDYLRRGGGQPDADPAREYLLRVSYLEVYKEHIRDLLATPPPRQGGAAAAAAASPPDRLFEANGELVVRGLQEVVVTSPEQVFRLLTQGEARRQTGATHLNQHSSRSHTLVRLWIESRRDGGGAVRVSSLSLVDLAGSESVRLTGSSDRQQEGHFINQSLMTLGKIVYQLSEMEENGGHNSRRQHIPYRDSKLTRLLQPSLSGNAQIALICCVSPLVSHIEESHNTFKFATRAKKIPQRATVQESLDDKTLLQSYKDEIEELKRQLKEAREQQAAIKAAAGVICRSDSSITASFSMASLSDVDEDEIQELVKSIQNMERLILRSNPNAALGQRPAPEDLLDQLDAEEDWNKDDEDGLMALVDEGVLSTPPLKQRPSSGATPVHMANGTLYPDDDLHHELRRVQGLLGSVLKKKRELNRTKSLDEDEEVRALRLQLEQQAESANLSKADSSFLQQQLAEKDSLLHEVYKVLEQVEQRQSALETENKALKEQLLRLKRARATANGHTH